MNLFAYIVQNHMMLTMRSMLVWPVAAIGSIMLSAGSAGENAPEALLVYYRLNVLYPGVFGAALLARYLLIKYGQERVAPLVLVAPLTIAASWIAFAMIFIAAIAASAFGLVERPD